jgi:hypothetical protein
MASFLDIILLNRIRILQIPAKINSFFHIIGIGAGTFISEAPKIIIMDHALEEFHVI